jgi:hypothetical protein
MKFTAAVFAFAASLALVSAQDLGNIPPCAVSSAFILRKPKGPLEFESYGLWARQAIQNPWGIDAIRVFLEFAPKSHGAQHAPIPTSQVPKQKQYLTRLYRFPVSSPPYPPPAASSPIKNANAPPAKTPSQKPYLHACPPSALPLMPQVRFAFPSQPFKLLIPYMPSIERAM